MTRFEIDYFDESNNLIGQEILLNIVEFPFFFNEDHPTFFYKKFKDNPCYRWQCLQIDSVVDNSTIKMKIKLQNFFCTKEEFLSQTLNRLKPKVTIGHLMYFGKLVEIDYGYIPNIKKQNGDIGSNKRYPSYIQKGEMHKRRIAIVLRVINGSTILVAPITSQDPKESLLSFKISSETTRNMLTYRNNDCWALCSNLQTVSVNRILPIKKIVPRGYRSEPERNTQYVFNITNHETKLLKSCLANLAEISRDEFFENKNKVNSLSKKIQHLEESIKELEVYKSACEAYGIDVKNDL